MDLSILDRASDVTPLLVRLYDNHKLYSLARDKDPQARLELVDAISELLQIESREAETELIADILITLIRQAETDLRQAIAERLSLMDNIPLRLVLMLANDEIPIATPVLRHSSVLGDLDLIYIIKSKGSRYWREIARRSNLSNKMIDMLAGTRDIETAMALAENEDITLTDKALTILSDLVQESEALAVPLLRRDEVTTELASRIYRMVGEELKSYILSHYDIAADKAAAQAEDIIVEFESTPVAQPLPAGEYMPTASMMEAAAQTKAKGQLDPALMIKALRRGQVRSFVALFSVYTDLAPAAVIRLLRGNNGLGIAVACKAFGIDKGDFLSMYLLSNSVRTQGRLVDIKEMGRAIERFEGVSRRRALEVVKML